MALVMSMVVAAGLFMVVYHFWKALLLSGEDDRALLKRLLGWAARGIVFPLVVWVSINSGVWPGVPILMRSVAVARAAGEEWFPLVLESAGSILVLVSSYWAALSMVWLFLQLELAGEEKKEFRQVSLFWLAVCAPFAGVLLWMGGISGAGFVVMLWLVVVAQMAAPVWRAKQVPPSYSRATGLLKQGKYNQAEWEVIRELERCENDFTGWLLLAELYAVHFRDLAAADRTIYDLCSQEETNPSEVCTALYKLAGWHVQVGEDPEAARQVIEVICKKWPGTALDQMARNKIRQLPASRQELLRQRAPHTIRLPALHEDGTVMSAVTPLGTEAASAQARRCVEKLMQDPNLVAEREELARLLAERLGQAEQGIEQLRLLLGMAEPEDAKRAEWLALIAAWEFRFQNDAEAGKQVLREIIEEHPHSVEAFTAQRRLNLMQIEERMKQNRLRYA